MAWHGTLSPQREDEFGFYHPEDGQQPTPQVIVEEDDGFSGIYNADGEPLYKQKRKIGFI